MISFSDEVNERKTNMSKKVKIDEPTILVCVSHTWGAAVMSRRTGKRVTLEDCARGYWKLSSSQRRDRAKWLMAFDKGVIVGVWEIGPKGWMKCDKSPKKSCPEDLENMSPSDREVRMVCELVPLDRKIWDKYVGLRLLEVGVEPRGGSIKYSFE